MIPRFAQLPAALFAVGLMGGPSPARAKCGCPSGSQSIAVGQETKADGCDLEIFLLKIDRGMLHPDQYHIYVKSKQIDPAIGGGQPNEHLVPQDGSTSLAARECGTLLIGAHRAPLKNYIELNWSYF